MLQELLEFSTNTFRQSFLFSLGPSLMDEEERRLKQKLSATASSLGLVNLHLSKNNCILLNLFYVKNGSYVMMVVSIIK